MSRLKIDFETEDTAVVCELADMLRRLHGKEGHTCCQQSDSGLPAFQYMKDVDTIVKDTAEKAFEASIALPPNPMQLLSSSGWPTAPPPDVHLVRTEDGEGVVDTLTGEVFTPQPPDPQEVETGADVIPYTPPPAGAVAELDADGIPWDGRIHSISKAKLAKTGQWKRARGCYPALAAKVIAELKVAMALPAAPSVTTPPAVAPPPPYLPEQQAVAPPPPVTAPVATAVLPPPVSPPTPVAAPATSAPTTFAAFLVAFTRQQAAKRITFDEVLAVLKEHGLENIQLLNARPDLIPAIYARLEGIWLTRG
jgi:hypothetical protein